MKICFVCPEYPPGPHGGVGTMTQVLARALVQAGHSVRVIGVYPFNYPAPNYEEDQGVRVWRLYEPRYKFGWISVRYQLFNIIKKWVRAGQVDLVESPDSRGWFAAWPGLSIPLVQRANGSYTYFAHELGQRVRRTTYQLEKWSYKRVSAWSAVTHQTAKVTKMLLGLDEPQAILYNPVNVPESIPSFADRDPNKIVFTGTLTAKKGIISLIDAWSIIQKHNKNLTLYILGKDGRAPSGENMQLYLYKRLPAEVHSSVQFYGHVSRDILHNTLLNARVAVFPSYAEAFGIAPVEAMACGCATIFTQRGSGPEVIEHSHSGLLVDPDSPSEIADTILQLVDRPQFAQQLSENGRERVLNMFTLEKLLPANLAFYQNSIHSFAEWNSKR